MAGLSEATVGRFLERFSKVAPDARPLWGSMTGAQMLGHVNATLLYTLGETPLVPFRGTFVRQYVFGPLVIHGIVKIPHNVRVPGTKKGEVRFDDGDFETLKASVERVLAEAKAGTFKPPHHPFFGNIGPKNWMRFHGVHFDHHLRQFGQ